MRTQVVELAKFVFAHVGGFLIREGRALKCALGGRRYFSNTELRDLFAVDEEGLNKSETSAQLAVLHGADRAYTAEVTKHLAKVHRIRIRIKPTGCHDAVLVSQCIMAITA